MNYKEIWIDIRDEHELAESQIIAPNDATLVINIPSRNIFANADWIKSMQERGIKITLVCRSASRSQNVKQLYFASDENIVSLEGGLSASEAVQANVLIKTSEAAITHMRMRMTVKISLV